MDLSDVDWAYLAGIIDADGCIRICGERRRRAPSSISVIVTNGSAPLVRWLRDELGGKPYTKGSQNCWNVWWTAQKAVAILEGIYPYLRIKRDEARLTMDFQALLGSSWRNGRKPHLTEDDLAKRHALMEAVAILKHRRQEV